MTTLDWLIILLYALLLVALGWRASRGVGTAVSHLRADRSLPAWAVVFSVLATEISAATYVGVPEAGYKGSWSYLQYAFGNLLGKWVLATVVIQLYWRLDLSSAYGFLRQRVGPLSQLTAAWSFLAGRLVASGVRLYIAALAFSAATGFSMPLAILTMALLSTVYTWFGGLRAVVATDVAQGAIFLVGALGALVVGLSAIDAPLGALAGEVWREGKAQVFFWSAGDAPWWTSTQPFPMAALGGFLLVLATHGTDQENVQHMLNTRSARSSSRSLLASALFTFPIVMLFLSVGSMLWLYHRHVAVSAYDPAQSPSIFPNFIVHALPSGVRGLAFAGLFAAAISSLGATLNATATIWISDIRGRAGLDTGRGEARRLNVVFGVLLCAVGLFFWRWSQGKDDGLVEIALSAMTLLYGGLLGGFLCALLYKRRGSDRGVALGMGAGVLIGGLAFFQRELLGLSADEPKLVEWPLTMLLSVLAVLAVAAFSRRATPGPDRAPRPAAPAGHPPRGP
jgi:SSS family transporter